MGKDCERPGVVTWAEQMTGRMGPKWSSLGWMGLRSRVVICGQPALMAGECELGHMGWSRVFCLSEYILSLGRWREGRALLHVPYLCCFWLSNHSCLGVTYLGLPHSLLRINFKCHTFMSVAMVRKTMFLLKIIKLFCIKDMGSVLFLSWFSQCGGHSGHMADPPRCSVL